MKTYNLWRHPHLWADVFVDGWVKGWAHVKLLKIDLNLIKIIQFRAFWTFLLKPPQPFTGLFLWLILQGLGPWFPEIPRSATGTHNPNIITKFLMVLLETFNRLWFHILQFCLANHLCMWANFLQNLVLWAQV